MRRQQQQSSQLTDHFDVLIVGAGLSGVGAACHLRERCPGKSFAILEARESLGGTWDLFRYPGIRSDSDMYTLGYSFEPWEDGKAIADGPSILRYIERTAREHDVQRHIRFGHRVSGAEWSSEKARWTVSAEHDGRSVQITCGFLYACTGYYRYEEGYTPPLPGLDAFGGRVVHPQHWPEDLDYAGKRVVVIGSGATAVTLVPAMARQAAHVTMLQRSPTYIVALPGRDALSDLLRKRLPARTAYAIVRWKNVLRMMASYKLSRRAPRLMRKIIRRGVRMRLPEGYDVGRDFEPRYDPWDERLCLVPDGDLFRAIGDGEASIATGTIETFTPTGVRLADGRELAADIVITATGLNLQMLGGMRLGIDGEPVELSERVAYKGMMLCGVPNMAMAIGYTNASWTLKCDLVAEYVCRLLRHMDAHGHAVATPQAPPASQPREPLIDLKSGYVTRSLHELPKQGAVRPWRLHQSNARDVMLLRRGPIEDEMAFAALPFAAPPAPAGERRPELPQPAAA